MSQESTSSDLAFLLNYLSVYINRQSEQILQEQLGIGFSQFKILIALQVNPVVGQKELASSLSQTEAAVSRQMKLLREKGLVISRVNPKNRREHRTLITSKGQRLREAASTLLEREYKQLFSVLDNKVQERLTNDMVELSDKIAPVSKHEGYRNLWQNMI